MAAILIRRDTRMFYCSSSEVITGARMNNHHWMENDYGVIALQNTLARKFLAGCQRTKQSPATLTNYVEFWHKKFGINKMTIIQLVLYQDTFCFWIYNEGLYLKPFVYSNTFEHIYNALCATYVIK